MKVLTNTNKEVASTLTLIKVDWWDTADNSNQYDYYFDLTEDQFSSTDVITKLSPTGKESLKINLTWDWEDDAFMKAFASLEETKDKEIEQDLLRYMNDDIDKAFDNQQRGEMEKAQDKKTAIINYFKK